MVIKKLYLKVLKTVLLLIYIMEDTCPICLDSFSKNKIKNNTIKLQCGHVFHKQCLLEWAKINPICALCRKYIISKFKIHQTKYYFLKEYYIIKITDKYLEIYKIEKNKIIVNSLFCLNLFQKNDDILGNNILKKKRKTGQQNTFY